MSSTEHSVDLGLRQRALPLVFLTIGWAITAALFTAFDIVEMVQPPTAPGAIGVMVAFMLSTGAFAYLSAHLHFRSVSNTE